MDRACRVTCPRDDPRLGFHTLKIRSCPHDAHRLWKALAGGTVRDCVVAVLSLDPVVLAANEEALLRPLGGGAA